MAEILRFDIHVKLHLVLIISNFLGKNKRNFSVNRKREKVETSVVCFGVFSLELTYKD